jgi:KaiC/GvpD/RAD55 family RecA-like ATPase
LVSTGVPSLDNVLGTDGYPDRSAVLVVGPPGIGKEALCYWFVRSGLIQGDYVLYATHRPVSDVLRDMKGIGISTERVPDWISSSGSPTKLDLRDATSISYNIKQAVHANEMRRVRVATDVLSPLLVLNPLETMYNYWTQLLSEMKTHDCVTLVLAEEGMHPPNVLTTMEQIFDSVIEMRLYEEGLSITPLFRIKRCWVCPPFTDTFASQYHLPGWRLPRMQLNDPLNLGVIVAYLFGSAVAGFGAFRALEMGNAFTSRLYRSRAYWTAALLGIIVVSNVFGYVPILSTWAIYNLSISEISFVFLILFIFIFVDRNLLTMKEIDFFHRDMLSWSQVRKGIFVAMLIVSVILLVISTLVNTNSSNIPPSLIAPLVAYFAVGAASLGYAALALVTGARRTPDRTMRNFSKLLGIALVLGILSFTIWIIPIVGNFVASLFALVSSYVLYLTVMSLSPVGRIEKATV